MTCIVYVLSIAPLMYTCFGFLIRYRYVKVKEKIILNIENLGNISRPACSPSRFRRFSRGNSSPCPPSVWGRAASGTATSLTTSDRGGKLARRGWIFCSTRLVQVNLHHEFASPEAQTLFLVRYKAWKLKLQILVRMSWQSVITYHSISMV